MVNLPLDQMSVEEKLQVMETIFGLGKSKDLDP
jgi:hypothetical protein